MLYYISIWKYARFCERVSSKAQKKPKSLDLAAWGRNQFRVECECCARVKSAVHRRCLVRRETRRKPIPTESGPDAREIIAVQEPLTDSVNPTNNTFDPAEGSRGVDALVSTMKRKAASLYGMYSVTNAIPSL